MTISVYVEGWCEQSSLQAEGIPVDSCQKGKDSYPEMNMSNVNWGDMSRALRLDTHKGTGELSIQEIPIVIRRCVRLVNSEVNRVQVVRVASLDGNVIDFGTSADYLLRKAERFMEILKFAQRLRKGVYWG